MTTLLTCSYRAYSPSMGQAVVTSLGLPRWRMAEAREWPRLWEATPRREYFDAAPDDFTTAYLAQLGRYGPQRIARRLGEIAAQYQADRLCLACFEPIVTDCHRGTFSAWLLATTGELAEEIIP